MVVTREREAAVVEGGTKEGKEEAEVDKVVALKKKSAVSVKEEEEALKRKN